MSSHVIVVYKFNGLLFILYICIKCCRVKTYFMVLTLFPVQKQVGCWVKY